MELQQDGLVLRNAGPADAATLADWWNDGAVMAHAGFPRGVGTTAEAVARSLAEDGDDTRRRLMLEYQGRPIGEMAYRLQDGNTAQIDIKICLPDCQGHGLGRRALCMLIRALWKRGIDAVVLDTTPENRRARHVYESLGFKQVRINEDSWTDQLGNLRSSVDYRLTPETFRDLW